MDQQAHGHDPRPARRLATSGTTSTTPSTTPTPTSPATTTTSRSASSARCRPHQKRRRFHRFQHLYLWLLYGLLPVKWQLFDDFYNIARGKIGNYNFARPKGWDLADLHRRQAARSTSLAFVIPLLFHPWWLVLGYVPAGHAGSTASCSRSSSSSPTSSRKPSSRCPTTTGKIEAALGRPPGADHRRLRPRQPGPELVPRRAELPDRAPPVPAHLPHPLPADQPLVERRARSSASSTTPTRASSRASRRTSAGCGRWARTAGDVIASYLRLIEQRPTRYAPAAFCDVM